MIVEERLKNRIILITGASSGIGRATAIRVSKEGGRCVLIGRRRDALQETLSLMDNREQHVFIEYDLTNLEHYADVFGILKNQDIVLDGLVHCAGISKIVPLRALTKNSMIELFDIHFFAFIELVRWYAKPGYSNGGSIAAVSAMNVHTPQKCMTGYAAAKAAMESACRTLALELVEKGIRINSVVVGGVSTPMAEKTKEMIGNSSGKYDNPVGRQLLGMGTAEQIASVVSFLLSDDSSFITGRELYADGGLF